ncbi:alpha/beta hydrolase [Paraburkholderia rhizosphaerae]|uniref:Acetyl esterase n=1 Tax=Paraburkholderia rhizosphaerae TaxID=480658 RepID=A0A4R8M033_9BURK|nr:alpha/beta hydrolase [Paraburkholderia rhizosphaerae]TDY54162.1 acetyl esterase [Paraburkholderia rhizosphaerae]
MDELDPQVLAMLDERRRKTAALPAQEWPQRLASVRERLERLSALGGSREDVAQVIDRTLPGPAGAIPVRIYDPRGTDDERAEDRLAAALVFYHGGGFVAGGLESHDVLLRALTNRAQCVIVAVDYRLAPEHPYPAANEDTWAALQWVHDHATELNIDAARVAVGGDSAGGLLAAYVAQRARRSGLSLRLQLLLYPNTDATMSRPSWQTFGMPYFLTDRQDMIERYDAWLPPGIDRASPDVSPLFATDLTGLAPALIITADHDALCDEGNEYAAKLRAAKVAVEHVCWQGMVHGFVSMAGILDAGKAAIERIAAVLRIALSQKRPD